MMQTQKSAMMNIGNFAERFRLFRWVGPIFDKELRVTARRKRNYVIRSFYLLLMLLVIALSWPSLYYSSSAAYQSAQMLQSSIELTVILTWLQFITVQILAVIFLSGAISDEIYHKTLGVMMTTPITGMQIVLGKLLSRMLSLIFLLGLSMPVLGLIRLLGGLPWGYVVSSLCITLTAMIFAGTVSLLISIFQKRAYRVIIQSILVLLILYLGIPVLIGWLTHWMFLTDTATNRIYFYYLSYINPFIVFSENMDTMMSAGMAAPLVWPWYCLISLSVSVFLLLLAAGLVRKAALLQITGQAEPKIFSSLWRRKQNQSGKETPSKLRTVRGRPMIWIETRDPWFHGPRKILTLIIGGIAAAMLLISYLVGFKEGYLDENYTHVTYGMIFFIVGIINMVILSATVITSEREAGSLPILLATPLSDRQIIEGKAGGVIFKSLPVWGLLIFHCVLFMMVGYIHPIVIVHLVLIIGGMGIFILGTGLFFSCLCRRTTSAVVANILLTAGLWVLFPVFGVLFGGGGLRELIILFHPVFQANFVLSGGCGEAQAGQSVFLLHYWVNDGIGVLSFTGVIVLSSLVYAGIGWGAGFLAASTLRRPLFE